MPRQQQLLIVAVLWLTATLPVPLLLVAQHGSSRPTSQGGAMPHRLWGVELHWGGPPLPGEAGLVAESSAIARNDFRWSATETVAGVYNFSKYDLLLAAMDEAGVATMWILDYGNALYTADDMAFPINATARKAFVNWALAAMEHFQHRGIIWELWNEPEGIGGLSRPTLPTLYSELCKELGIRLRAHPTAQNELLVGPAAAGVDWPLISSLGKQGCLEYLDGVSVHPYSARGPEWWLEEGFFETLRVELDKVTPAGAEDA